MMSFKEYLEQIDESVTYGKRTFGLLKKYKGKNTFVIFSDEQKPLEQRLHHNIPLKGIIAYPVNHLLKKIEQDKVFEIPGWPTKKYAILVRPKENCQILDTRKYGATFKTDVERLKKWYLKNLPPSSGRGPERFDTFVYNAKNKDLPNKFEILLDIMRQMRRDIDVLLDVFFHVYRLSALYTSREEDSFATYNPEIIFFSYKYMEIIDIIDNK